MGEPTAITSEQAATLARGYEDVVNRARLGDDHAFTCLVEPLAVPAYRLALAILGSRVDAEDAVQNATLRAWRRLSTLRAASAFRGWYLAVVVNSAKSIRRARWRAVFEMRRAVATGPDEGDMVEGIQAMLTLRRLSPNDRAALYLAYVEDLSVNETAAILGISQPATKSRISRAADRFRRMSVEV